jgi:dGTPase
MSDNLPLFTREHQEHHEQETLACYASHAADSLGRVYPEEEHAFRTCFQRDRDRIIHCVAFRRLEYKTQVFVNSAGDHYRTRLTHTLEVAQITRTLGRILGANEDLCEAIALAHDLGHPPFGHAGERVLNRLLDTKGGFEHNAQALRIVDRLETRYPTFPGLNLTAETRRAILKDKPGYQNQGHGLPATLSIEAQIMDLADEISYTTHDLDDGIESHFLNREDVMQVPLWKEAYEAVEKRFPLMTERHKRYQIIIYLINRHVMDAADTTRHRLEETGYHLKNDTVMFSPEMREKCNAAREYLWSNLYRHPKVLRSMSRCQRIIEKLFEHYQMNPEQLPFSFQNRIDADGLDRTVCDYIAGMTDRYAEEDFRQLYGY